MMQVNQVMLTAIWRLQLTEVLLVGVEFQLATVFLFIMTTQQPTQPTTPTQPNSMQMEDMLVVQISTLNMQSGLI